AAEVACVVETTVAPGAVGGGAGSAGVAEISAGTAAGGVAAATGGVAAAEAADSWPAVAACSACAKELVEIAAGALCDVASACGEATTPAPEPRSARARAWIAPMRERTSW